MRLRRRRAAVALGRGETELALALSEGRPVVGTRDAVYVPAADEHVRVPWEHVEGADWDQEAGVLRLREVGTWGERRPEHVLAVEDPGRLLELVRERVTASVLLQRYVALDDGRGVRVIARRAPSGAREVTWLFEYDEGVDPDDPFVVQVAESALATAREEVGL